MGAPRVTPHLSSTFHGITQATGGDFNIFRVEDRAYGCYALRTSNYRLPCEGRSYPTDRHDRHGPWGQDAQSLKTVGTER